MTLHPDYTIVNGRRITFATSAARHQVVLDNPQKAAKFDILRAAHKAEALLEAIGQAVDAGYSSEALTKALDRVAFLSETIFQQSNNHSPHAFSVQCGHCQAAPVDCPHCEDGYVPF